jgi:hypothetical protein
MLFWTEASIGNQVLKSEPFGTLQEARREACRMLANNSNCEVTVVSENGPVMSSEKTADWCAKHTSKPIDTPTGYFGWGKLEVILLILLLAGMIALLKHALFS